MVRHSHFLNGGNTTLENTALHKHLHLSKSDKHTLYHVLATAVQ